MRRFKSTHQLTGQVFTYFSASAIQGILALALIPLATRILGAEEFGVYALLMAVAALLAVVAEFGSGIILSGHYLACNENEKKHLLASISVLSLSVAVAQSLALFALWPIISSWLGADIILNESELLLVSASIPLRTMVNMSAQIFVIQSHALKMGLIIVVQSLGTFVMTLIALYGMALGQTSLFLGNTMGLVLAAGCAFHVLRDDCRAVPSKIWVKRLLLAAPSSVASGILDNVRSALEATTLTRVIGTAGLAIYNHGRLYSGYLFQVTNAFGNALWATALKEAHNEGEFEIVGKVWNAVYLFITIAGVALTAISYELVSILTHGKFVNAAFWVPFWVAYLLIQNSGKPASAVLYAAHRGALMARLRVITTLGAVLGIFTAIPAYGIAGGVAVAFAEMLAFRLLLQHYALKTRPLPFQDFWVFAGVVLIVVLDIGLVGQNLSTRLITCTGVIVILLLLRRKIVIDIIGHIYRNFFVKKQGAL